jgi:hypothetical protein
MKNLLLTLILCALSGCANLPLPRWVTNEHLTAHVPLGFFSHVDPDGGMNIGMPEVTNGVSVEKIAREEEFQQRARRDLDLTRRVYPKDWVSITEITTLGHLKGKGFKTVVSQFKNDPELSEESYLFLVESDGWWLVSAASKSGDKSGWRSILASLDSKKRPNQAPEPTAPSGRGSS